MHLSVREAATGRTYAVAAEPGTTVEVLVLRLAACYAMNYNTIRLLHRGVLLDRAATVGPLGVGERDLLDLERPRERSPALRDVTQRARSLLRRYIASPAELDQLGQSDPALFEAIVSESEERVAALLRGREPAAETPIAYIQGSLLPAELDVEYQRQLEKRIAGERLEELAKDAYEHYPELFVPTEMLFLRGSVNRVETLVFVDTGAQTTILSREFAERARVLKDVDQRYAGRVVGVGTQTSLGRIWKLTLDIGGEHFLLSCTVLANFPHDFLLGLDMMKRHRCAIDLAAFCISFGDSVRVPFVSEHQLGRAREESNRPKLAALRDALNVGEEVAAELLERADFSFERALELGLELRREGKI